MIALGLHESFFLNKNLMLALLYLISTQWFKTNLGLKEKALGKTMLEITSTGFCHHISSYRAFSMTHHVLTHPNKMGWPRGKMGIYLTQPEPCSFKRMFLSPIGGKLFLLPHT